MTKYPEHLTGVLGLLVKGNYTQAEVAGAAMDMLSLAERRAVLQSLLDDGVTRPTGLAADQESLCRLLARPAHEVADAIEPSAKLPLAKALLRQAPYLHEADVVNDLMRTSVTAQLATVTARNMDAIEVITELMREAIDTSPASTVAYDEGYQRGQQDLARKVLEALQREMTK